MQKGVTPLILAAYGGQIKMAQALLADGGADIEGKSDVSLSGVVMISGGPFGSCMHAC